MGVAYILVAVSLNTSVQARVDESHRGRVLSIYLMGLLAGVPLGALLGGAVAESVGLRETVIGGGAVLGAFAVVAVIAYNGMRPLDEGLDDVAGRHPTRCSRTSSRLPAGLEPERWTTSSSTPTSTL